MSSFLHVLLVTDKGERSFFALETALGRKMQLIIDHETPVLNNPPALLVTVYNCCLKASWCVLMLLSYGGPFSLPKLRSTSFECTSTSSRVTSYSELWAL